MDGKLKRKVKTTIIISLLSLVIFSGVQAVKVERQKLESSEAKPINLGTMYIQEGHTWIKLKHDNLINVKGGSQTDIYHFVIDYNFLEGSNINQEKWVFSINMSGRLDTSEKIEHVVTFDDHYYNNDEGSGEIWIEITGQDIWIENANFIQVECSRYADILWLSDFNLIDRANEQILVRVNNFPEPELEWSASEGDTWTYTHLNQDLPTKDFEIKNIGPLSTDGVSFELTGSADFSFVSGNDDSISLSPQDSHVVTVSFNPSSKDKKTAILRAKNDNEWYTDTKEITLTGEKEAIRLKSFIGLEDLFAKFPMMQRLLLHL